MSFGSSQTITNTAPRVGAFRVQQSAQGLVIPLLWGTNRVTGNMLWYGDFEARKVKTTTSSGGRGGKGGGGSVKQENITWTYHAALILGLCHGPVSAIGRTWKDKEVINGLPAQMSFAAGAVGQSPWSYLSSKHPGYAIGYSQIAYVYAAGYDLTDSASMPQHSFEITGPGAGTMGSLDARPSLILQALLSDPTVGVGFPSASVGDLTSYNAWCTAAGMGMSPLYDTQQEARELIGNLLQATHAAPVWSGGKLKIIPWSDEPLGGFVPAVTPVYDLTDDDFLPNEGGPVRVLRKRPADRYNAVTVEFQDRDNGYNTAVAEAQNLEMIERHGLRPRNSLRLHGVCRRSHAQLIADAIKQRDGEIVSEYRFSLPWRYLALEPMDAVTLTEPRLGMTRLPVRIIEVVETDDGIDITAEDLPIGAASPAQYDTEASDGYSVNYNVAPGNVATPVIFEAPSAWSTTGLEVLVATTGQTAEWGGCDVWVSLDDASYRWVARIDNGARYGELIAAMTSGDGGTAEVRLYGTGGQLLPATAGEADAAATLCYADGEYFAHEGATLTGVNTYTLSGLRRGLHATGKNSHAAGAKFVRVDGEVARSGALDPSYIGKTLYFKFTSYNIFGAGQQSLADVGSHAYTVTGAMYLLPPAAVTGLVDDGEVDGSAFRLRWDVMPDADEYNVRVIQGGILRREIDTVGNLFQYDWQDAKKDGGPWRALVFEVRARKNGVLSTTPATIAITNPQFAAPVTPSVERGASSFVVYVPKPTTADYAGTIFWASQTAGFTPSDANKVYEGLDTAFTLTDVSGTWFFRAAHYDVWGRDGLNVSSEVTNSTASASGIPDVTALPADPDAVGGAVVVRLMPDNQLYGWDGDSWERPRVGPGDLMPDAVIASNIYSIDLKTIQANVGELNTGTLRVDPTGFIRGGQLGYNVGNGFWMGYHVGEYRFSMGNANQDRLTFDSAGLNVQGVFRVTDTVQTGVIANPDLSGGYAGWYQTNGSPVAQPYSGTDALWGYVTTPGGNTVAALILDGVDDSGDTQCRSAAFPVAPGQIINLTLRINVTELSVGGYAGSLIAAVTAHYITDPGFAGAVVTVPDVSEVIWQELVDSLVGSSEDDFTSIAVSFYPPEDARFCSLAVGV